MKIIIHVFGHGSFKIRGMVVVDGRMLERVLLGVALALEGTDRSYFFSKEQENEFVSVRKKTKALGILVGFCLPQWRMPFFSLVFFSK